MSYNTLVEGLKKGAEENQYEDIEVYELTIGWLAMSNEDRAALIEDVKENGTEFTSQLLKEIAEDAKKYQVAYENRFDIEEFKILEVDAAEKLKAIPREKWGTLLRGADEYRNVPTMGIKAGRLAHALGASPETSEKVMMKTAGGIEGVKRAFSSGAETLPEKAAEVSDRVKEVASEHGGKIAAATAAGLGALALARKLRNKKKEQGESAPAPA